MTKILLNDVWLVEEWEPLDQNVINSTIRHWHHGLTACK